MDFGRQLLFKFLAENITNKTKKKTEHFKAPSFFI